MLSRRNFLLTGGATLTAPMMNRGRFALLAGGREYSRRTLDLVKDSVVVDMLGLVTLDWQKLGRWRTDPNSFRAADCHKLLRSGITVFHPAVDLDAPAPFEATREWLRDWDILIGNHPGKLLRVGTVADLTRAKTERITGIIPGLQNSNHFRSPEDVSYFHSLGQRVSQLTYNEVNLVGSGCTEPKDSGLTEFGVRIISEMNRVGIAIDVSHSGDCTTRDAIEASRKPALITHSNCRALNPHPRCKPDDAIRCMAAKGGVFGITGVRQFVRSGEPTTVEDVLDHFDYATRLVGVEHVGIGSDTDLDGRDRFPGAGTRMDIQGLDQPLRIYELTEGLVRRGYSNSHIRLILGANFQRALSEIW